MIKFLINTTKCQDNKEFCKKGKQKFFVCGVVDVCEKRVCYNNTISVTQFKRKKSHVDLKCFSESNKP